MSKNNISLFCPENSVFVNREVNRYDVHNSFALFVHSTFEGPSVIYIIHIFYKDLQYQAKLACSVSTLFRMRGSSYYTFIYNYFILKL